jgi:toxin ParE1/3/4
VRIIWTPEAQQDRTDIWDYIAADSPRAAVKLNEVFSKAAARLADHPKLGRTGRVIGTCEVIPHKSYCLVYEIEQEAVWVLALVHSARQWPPVTE